MITRRKFLENGLLGSALLLSPNMLLTACTSGGLRASGAGRGPASDVLVRYNVNSAPGLEMVKIYEAAVAKMQANPAMVNGIKSGWNWDNQANIHNDSCPHGSWEFFPWHRDYLNRFEEIIRAVSGRNDFVLPYWDWSTSPTLPKPFTIEGSSLFRRGRTFNPARVKAATSKDIMKGIMQSTDHESFMGSSDSAGETESGPHNSVHVAVGGIMADFRSPLDPVFWLHHCNVDRIWSDWQDKNTRFKSPDDIKGLGYGKWLGLPLKGFYERDGKPISKDRIAADMLRTENLGYRYDTGTGPTRARDVEPEAVMAVMTMQSLVKESIQPYRVAHLDRKRKWSLQVDFPEFRNDLMKYYRAYFLDPSKFAGYEFRVKATNIPELPPGWSIDINYLIGLTMTTKPLVIIPDEENVGHRTVFGHGSGIVMNFKKVMDALNGRGVKNFRTYVSKNGKRTAEKPSGPEKLHFVLHFVDDRFANVAISDDWMAKFKNTKFEFEVAGPAPI